MILMEGKEVLTLRLSGGNPQHDDVCLVCHDIISEIGH